MTAFAQSEESLEPFVFLAKVTGGDIPIPETAVYDSFSKEYINVWANETIKKTPDSEKIQEIATDLEFSGITTLTSDIGSCDFSTICYLLQVTLPFGTTGAVESHMVYWNSNSGESYDNLTQIVKKIISLKTN